MMSEGIKILLIKDVDKLGWLGDVVEVNAGYARNYLLPEGLAVVPTQANLKSIAEEKAKRAEQRLLDRKRLESAAAAVEGAEAVVAAAANEFGHLFGSVGKTQIATNLREQGFEVADEVVQLHENIKEVGTTEVTLKFADDLKAKVKVVVVAADSEGGPAKQKSTSERETEVSQIPKVEVSEQRGVENESSETVSKE
jgi:large subunit ribosomal protein L9